MKRKDTKDKLRREKMFEIDDAIDGENSRSSSCQLKENYADKREHKGCLDRCYVWGKMMFDIYVWNIDAITS